MNSFYVSYRCCIGFSLLWESEKIIRKYILEVQILHRVWYVFCSSGSSEKTVIFNYWLSYTRNIWNRNNILWECCIMYLSRSDFFLDKTCKSSGRIFWSNYSFVEYSMYYSYNAVKSNDSCNCWSNKISLALSVSTVLKCMCYKTEGEK